MPQLFIRSVLVLLFTALPIKAELRLPALFSDHMVLQQNLENPVWGWADAGSQISVTIAGHVATTQVGEDGRWVVKLPAMQVVSDPLEMVVTNGDATVTVSDILIGEVWLCSGQSNMQWSVRQAYDADLEAATANYPQIRLITVPQVGTQEPQQDFVGRWDVCSPETVVEFSAVGYFFGRQLHQTLGVPIGLIDNAWGGSAAEAWVAREVIEADGRFDAYLAHWENVEQTYEFEKALQRWEEAAAAAKAAGKKTPRRPRDLLAGQHRPGNLWAGVLHPLIGYGIRGTIWYQGESNSGRAYQYDDLFGLMIQQWRQAWGQGDFSFYWVQLADYRDEVAQPGESDWAELREAQTNTLALPNTGQAVIYDVGEGRDIHPRDKQTVAKRLARIALARDYGKAIPYLSPSFESLDIQGERAILTFKDVGSTLYTFDVREARGFALAGADRVWHPATGQLKGKNSVVVTSEFVPEPVAVRYAWAVNPVANLFSREGLPVVPFRTDDWPMVTEPKPAAE